ncbi:MAG: tetratricopeptide repeat protein, partial [Alphaproteobacteria bacterium]
AHDNYLRSLHLILTNMDAEGFRRAVSYGQRAIELDPNYAQAYGGVAVAYVLDSINRWSDDPDSALAKGADFAARAVELDPNDPGGHHAVGLVAMWSGDLDASIAAFERCLSLSPNYVYAVFTRGCISLFAGQPEEAIPQIERAVRLDPAFSQQYLHYLGVAHLLLGHDETAALLFRERLLLATDTDIGRAMLAATLGHLGEVEEARQIWKDLLEINPDFNIEQRLRALPFANPSDTDRIVEGLTKAGLPD